MTIEIFSKISYNVLRTMESRPSYYLKTFIGGKTMKKKILSAVLAMVICFSAFSFVAIADEEAVAGAKTRADLQDLIGGFSASWLDNDLWDYGTLSAERFEAAIGNARNVLADGDAEASDITVAYVLVDAAFENLVKKSQAELNTLVAEVRPTFNRENMLNSAEDEIFIPECENLVGSWLYEDNCPNDCPGSGPEGLCGYARFAEAYGAVEWNSDEDSNTITDLYTELEDSFNALVRKQVVTRAEMNSLERAVGRAGDLDEKFTPERRGTVTAPWGERFSTFRHDTGSQGWTNSGHIPLSWAVLWDLDELPFSGTLNSGGWWNAFVPYEQAAGTYSGAMDDFADLGTASTTDNDIVEAYEHARTIVALINSFTGDGTGRGNERALRNLMDNNHNAIVQAQNVLASPSSLARASGWFGTGALRALYLEIGGFTAPDLGTSTLPTRAAEVTISVDDDGRFVADDNGAAGPETLRLRAGNRTIDLTSVVRIDALAAAPPAWVISEAQLNAIPRRNYAAHRPLATNGAFFNAPRLGAAYADAQTMLNNRDASISPGHDDDGFVLAVRQLTYAINDVGLRDNMESRARLEALVEASFAVNEKSVAFFRNDFILDNGNNGGNPVDVTRQVNDARDEARDVLRFYNNAQRGLRTDRVDQRDYAIVYGFEGVEGEGRLAGAVWEFNQAFATFPVAMNIGELSVYDVIMASMASTSENVIELRNELALKILEDVRWEYIHSDRLPDEWFSGNIFDRNGSINATARLRALDADYNPGPWPAFAAYAALRDALGLGVVAGGKGDVNGDGAITTADAIEILRYIAGLESVIDDNPLALVAASITADAPTTACAIAILQRVAGLPSALDDF
jgi:hypothetical protein